MAQLEMKRAIVLTTVPTTARIIGQLDGTITVYYRVDSFDKWPGHEARLIQRMETQAIRSANALIATSRRLIAGQAIDDKHTLVLPHGVDLEHFTSGGVEPDALSTVPRPRLMCAGLLDERVDLTLLAELAHMRPDWHIVLVGPRALEAVELEHRDNVHLFPAVPYADLPAWLSAADVLMIPYVRTVQTDTISPLKLREYLASGRPVATTRLPEVVREYGALIQVGDDATSFRDAISRALADSPDSASLRRQAVRKDTWVARADALCDFLAEVEKAA
ncbi:MAG: glycosyltransferase [Gammaproteobacteria bacterium]